MAANTACPASAAAAKTTTRKTKPRDAVHLLADLINASCAKLV
jgi:hypothetical protein